jgi:hypothetical protein
LARWIAISISAAVGISLDPVNGKFKVKGVTQMTIFGTITKQELAAKIQKARQEFEDAGEFQILLDDSSDDVADRVKAAHPLAPPPPIESAEVTKAELDQIDAESTFEQIFGEPMDTNTHLPPVFQTLVKNQLADAIDDLVTPQREEAARRANVIREEIRRAFAKTSGDGRVGITPRSTPERQLITLRDVSEAADADDPNTPLAKLLRSYANGTGTKQQMRETVRQMLRAN